MWKEGIVILSGVALPGTHSIVFEGAGRTCARIPSALHGHIIKRIRKRIR
jgi:hypothetical protein